MCPDVIYILISNITSQGISSIQCRMGLLFIPGDVHREAETCALKAWKACLAEECGPAGMKPGLFAQCKQEASDGCNKEN
jgi:hypothetical protein